MPHGLSFYIIIKKREEGIQMRKNVRLETITPQWLENSKMRVKESTYVKYVNLATNHILPQLGEVQVSCLTTEVIEQFVQYKNGEGHADRA